jgi:hypothetical protein
MMVKRASTNVLAISEHKVPRIKVSVNNSSGSPKRSTP